MSKRRSFAVGVVPLGKVVGHIFSGRDVEGKVYIVFDAEFCPKQPSDAILMPSQLNE